MHMHIYDYIYDFNSKIMTFLFVKMTDHIGNIKL